MLPSEIWKAGKIGVGGNHGATMLQGDRSVLGVSDQLASGPRDPAQPFENGHVIRPRTDDARGWAFRERGHEGECRIQRRGRVERAGVGHDAKEPGKDEDRQGERFRSGRHADKPIRVPVMIGDCVLDMRIDEDIDIRQQHGESTLAIPGFIVLGLKRSRLVEIDARARTDAAYRHQPERGWLGALSLLERIVQGPGNERAHADAPGGRFPAHLSGESVVKGNGRSHGEENNDHASLHQIRLRKLAATTSSRYGPRMQLDSSTNDRSSRDMMRVTIRTDGIRSIATRT